MVAPINGSQNPESEEPTRDILSLARQFPVLLSLSGDRSDFTDLPRMLCHAQRQQPITVKVDVAWLSAC